MPCSDSYTTHVLIKAMTLLIILFVKNFANKTTDISPNRLVETKNRAKIRVAADLKVKLDNFFWLNFVIMMYNLIKQCNSG